MNPGNASNPQPQYARQSQYLGSRIDIVGRGYSFGALPQQE